jgi:hypothetical protein
MWSTRRLNDIDCCAWSATHLSPTWRDKAVRLGAVAFPLQIFSWCHSRSYGDEQQWQQWDGQAKGPRKLLPICSSIGCGHAGGWRLTAALLTSRSGRPAVQLVSASGLGVAGYGG